MSDTPVSECSEYNNPHNHRPLSIDQADLYREWRMLVLLHAEIEGLRGFLADDDYHSDDVIPQYKLYETTHKHYLALGAFHGTNAEMMKATQLWRYNNQRAKDIMLLSMETFLRSQYVERHFLVAKDLPAELDKDMYRLADIGYHNALIKFLDCTLDKYNGDITKWYNAWEMANFSVDNLTRARQENPDVKDTDKALLQMHPTDASSHLFFRAVETWPPLNRWCLMRDSMKLSTYTQLYYSLECYVKHMNRTSEPALVPTNAVSKCKGRSRRGRSGGFDPC